MCGNPENVPHVVCASEGDGITKSGGSGKVPIGRPEPRPGPGEEAREAKMEQTGASRGRPKSTGRLSIPIERYQETAFGRKENSRWLIARQEKRHTRCCVIPGSPSGELGPGGRLGRGSDRRDRKTRSDVQKLNGRVRQEEGRMPAGVVQQSQWAGGSWE